MGGVRRVSTCVVTPEGHVKAVCDVGERDSSHNNHHLCGEDSRSGAVGLHEATIYQVPLARSRVKPVG